VIANPPFNDSKWGGEKLRKDPRWKYGVPPVQNANFAWLQHFLHHCAPTGTVGTVLANGSLSGQQSGEGDIRRAMVEADVVECIVSLPRQLFYGTQIPVCLWLLTKNKGGIPNTNKTRPRHGETLFIDARQIGHMEARTLRAFSEADIMRISDTYHSWRGTESSTGEEYADMLGFCRAVTMSDIAEHGYVLTPGRYVGSEEAEDDDEPLDEKIARLGSEIRDGFKRREDLQATVLAALDALVVADG
jgi:type I restriction enzyme M protein